MADKEKKISFVAGTNMEDDEGSVEVVPAPKKGKKKKQLKQSKLNLLIAERPKKETSQSKTGIAKFAHTTIIRVNIPIVVTDAKIYGQFQSKLFKIWREVMMELVYADTDAVIPFDQEVIKKKQAAYTEDQLPLTYREL